MAKKKIIEVKNEKYKEALQKEVESAADVIAAFGDCTAQCEDESDEEINSEWLKTLDKAFDLINNFSKKHGLKPLV